MTNIETKQAVNSQDWQYFTNRKDAVAMTLALTSKKQRPIKIEIVHHKVTK